MIEGVCHCGSVKFKFHDQPEFATSCNCSICRRLGAVWIYARAKNIEVIESGKTTIRYAHGDKNIIFHTCQICGSSTHWENAVDPVEGKMAVNLNLVDSSVASKIKVRKFDGADTWSFID